MITATVRVVGRSSIFIENGHLAGEYRVVSRSMLDGFKKGQFVTARLDKDGNVKAIMRRENG